MDDFEAFAARYIDELLRAAVLITWDNGEAEDLVQETLIKVAKRWQKISGMAAPQAYARKILVNLAIDGSVRRSRWRRELEPPAVLVEASVDPLSALEDRQAMLAALGELPKQARAVLVLRYYNDLSEARIADILGCSTGAVKNSAFRGLAQLRQDFATSTSEPGSQS